MKQFFIKQLLTPLPRKLGTLLGATLGAYGVSTDTINLVVAGAVALAGLLIDAGLRNFLGGK